MNSPRPTHACRDGGRALHVDGHVYCQMCGGRLLACAATPPRGGELVCIVDDRGAARPQQVTLSTAGSVHPVPIRVEAGHPAMRVSAGSHDPVPSTLEPESAVALEVRADALSVAELADSVETELRILFPGTMLAPISVPVRLGRRSVIDGDAVDLGSVKRGATARGVVRVRHAGGVSARIVDVEPKSGLSTAGLALGHRLSSGESHEASIEIDTADVLAPGEHKTELVIKWDSGSRTRIPIRVSVVPAAELTLSARGARDAPRGLAADVRLVLRNDSPFEVAVTSLAAGQAPAWFHMDPQTLPLRIAPEKTHEVPCQIDATAMPLGAYSVTITAGIEDGRPVVYQLAGRVVELPPYPHPVAMDFGTTSSCVAYWSGTALQLVPFRDPVTGEFDTIVPSVAFFDPSRDRWLAGFEARQAAEAAGRPELLVRSVKRLLNRGWFEAAHGHGEVDLGGRRVAPETVVAAILTYLKRQAEQHLKAAVETVILTLPANFTDTGIRAFLRAARAAGLEPFTSDASELWERHRIDEPTAAALDVAQRRAIADAAEERVVVVFDFGGGTLDVSVLLVAVDDDTRHIDVIAHKGANRLGGDEFTKAMIGLIAREFRKEFPDSRLLHDVAALQDTGKWDGLDEVEQSEAFVNAHDLWEAAEKAKIDLTTQDRVAPLVTVRVNGRQKTFTAKIARAEFNNAITALADGAADMIDRAVRSCRRRPITVAAIDHVIVTGRASLVPLVMSTIEARTNRKPIVPGKESGPKECVARGACRYGLEAIAKVRALGSGSLVLTGIHEYTNSSYGFDAVESEGLATRYVFVPVIPEGVDLRRAAGQAQQTFRKRVAQLNDGGSAKITIFQHPGDPDQNVIDDNSEIVAIDTIDVHGVRVDPRRRPAVEVEMWIAPDGLLDAVARVDGHDRAFPLESRYRV